MVVEISESPNLSINVYTLKFVIIGSQSTKHQSKNELKVRSAKGGMAGGDETLEQRRHLAPMAIGFVSDCTRMISAKAIM